MDKQREKLNLTVAEARELVWGDLPGFEEISNKIIGTSRWSINNQIVVKRISDGKFFKDNYRVGATEGQEERPYEYAKPDFREVFPKKVEVIIYE